MNIRRISDVVRWVVSFKASPTKRRNSLKNGRRTAFKKGIVIVAGLIPTMALAEKEYGYLSSTKLPPIGEGLSAITALFALLVVVVAALVFFLMSFKRSEEEVRLLRSRLKQKEKELSIAKRSSRAAYKAKKEFLSNMSHELRTPLNAILGMSQLALDSGLQGKQQRYVKRVMTAAHTLLHAVNAVLDFTSVKSGSLEIEWVECNVETILSPVASALGERANDKGLQFSVTVDMSIPKVIDADSVRMTQVLMALGDNAIKFTSEGEVSISVSLESRREDDVMIRFSIRDSGQGIRRKDLEALFAPFSQADNSISREHGGKGLGLSLSKELVALMGGELQADSRYGEGSVFSFTLPCQSGVRETSRLGGAWSRSLTGISALVVATNKTQCLNICNPLVYAGANVSQCRSLDELEECKPSIERGIFSKIIVDWENLSSEMVSVLTNMLVELPKEKAIYLLAGKHHGLDICETRPPFGFDVITKPVLPTAFLRAVTEEKQEVCLIKGNDRHGELELEDIPEDELAIRNKVILLVEDNLINQEVALGALETLPVNVLVANNGEEAIEMVKQHCIDLVLMDMQMPVVDGVTATKFIRQEMEITDLPILAMTANTDAHDVAACKDAGMNEHIAKPIEFDALKQKVTDWLKRGRGSAFALQAEPVTVVEACHDEVASTEMPIEPNLAPVATDSELETEIHEETAAVDEANQLETNDLQLDDEIPPEAEQTRRRVIMEYDETMFDLMVDNVPGINLGEGVKRLGGNKAKYLKILSLFLNSQMTAMDQLLADGDNADKAILAHSCKGAGSNIGANDISDAACILEDKYNAGEVVSESEILALKAQITAAIEKFDEIASSAATVPEPEIQDEEIKPLDAYLVDQINALQTSLQEFDIGVQDKVSQLSKSLPQWCNQLDEFKKLQEAISQFDFLTAEEHLKDLKKKTG
ncbi:ATP-binding protein [Enterovibrio sp. ZSDZ35]|uniref:histidine kinase n=1 Tax=Enterovibrio qingdaonensis TaxID=2899818 RepID=A0ABT5QKC8_9GAMM|nr:ATP-binding protein [Enterovibrio sp. ZSDZ35]MDD1781442.1 ATP-binding protein [Enterovibrio sp. ZSDZ35]